jgi:hypothetical protein
MTVELYKTHDFGVHRNGEGCFCIYICQSCYIRFDQTYELRDIWECVQTSCEDEQNKCIAEQVAERLGAGDDS